MTAPDHFEADNVGFRSVEVCAKLTRKSIIIFRKGLSKEALINYVIARSDATRQSLTF